MALLEILPLRLLPVVTDLVDEIRGDPGSPLPAVGVNPSLTIAAIAEKQVLPGPPEIPPGELVTAILGVASPET
jgi:hypothetical protein